MIKFEINGIEIEAEPGSMIIQAADRLSIPIPRFCYHHKLSIAANCRMCLVHVDKSPKPLPACATPVTQGMKVWTADKVAVDAQKAVMEFLLINHPLDCPICDQGGECELQDTSLEFGADVSRFSESKRVVEDHSLGPLVATDLTRCIQCTRCVRFGEEISGERELGATGRGEFMKIGTFVNKHVNSEVSGNIIDLCPVGALTSKPFRFKARAWELDEYPGVSPHDCIGSNLYLHVRNNRLMRVVPRGNDELNEVWLSDRDRFSYQALEHQDRLRKPMLLKHNKWNIVSWVEALKYAAAGIKLVIDSYGANQLAVLTSPNATIEELFLLQHLARSLGSPNIDHRLRQADFSDEDCEPLYPHLGIKLKDINNLEGLLLIGSHIHKEQPIVGLRIRKMASQGGKVCVVNPAAFTMNFNIAAQHVATNGDLVQALAEIAKALLITSQSNHVETLALFEKIKPSPQAEEIAHTLLSCKQSLVVLGQLALTHPHASNLRALANLIANLVGGKFGTLPEGANSAGAWLTGCVPHRSIGGTATSAPGKNALQMLSEPLKCYLLYAIEPEFDSILGSQAIETLKQADFVIAVSAFQSERLLEVADVILPLAIFAEISGTTVNIDGKWQTAKNVIMPFGESRPGWKILRVLGNLLELKDFEYFSEEQVLDLIKQQLGNIPELPSGNWQLPCYLQTNHKHDYVCVRPISLYAVDSIVRRASALQATQDAHTEATIQLNLQTATKLQVKTGDMVNVKSKHGSAKLPVEINDAVADYSVIVYQANSRTLELGMPYVPVEISKC